MGLKCLIILEQRVKNAPEVYMNSGNVFLDNATWGRYKNMVLKMKIFLRNTPKK